MSNSRNQVKKEPNGLFKAIGTQKLAAVTVLTVSFMFFWIFGDNFAKYSTLVSTFDSPYCIGSMAIGVTFVIITGETDLSIDTVCVCCSLISGMLYTKLGLPMPLCVIPAILTGGPFGFANGLMVSVMRLPAFIATLGAMMTTRGLGSIMTDTTTVTSPQAPAPDGPFRGTSKSKGAGFPQAGTPTGSILLTILTILMAVLLNKVCPGRYILPPGSNEEATRLSGVNVVEWETLTYVIGGLFVGPVGVSYAAVYSTLMPGTGNGFEPDAIAGAVIGGASLAGGVGSILGILIGVFIMSVLETDLPLVRVRPHYQLLITGFVLIMAVLVDVPNRRKQGKDRYALVTRKAG